jgi:hypothetical protein
MKEGQRRQKNDIAAVCWFFSWERGPPSTGSRNGEGKLIVEVLNDKRSRYESRLKKKGGGFIKKRRSYSRSTAFGDWWQQPGHELVCSFVVFAFSYWSSTAKWILKHRHTNDILGVRMSSRGRVEKVELGVSVQLNPPISGLFPWRPCPRLLV